MENLTILAQAASRQDHVESDASIQKAVALEERRRRALQPIQEQPRNSQTPSEAELALSYVLAGIDRMGKQSSVMPGQLYFEDKVEWSRAIKWLKRNKVCFLNLQGSTLMFQRRVAVLCLRWRTLKM